MKMATKTQLVRLINKIGKMRKEASYLENDFAKMFQEIYGYEFDFYKHDFLVDVIQNGDSYLQGIEDFEIELNFSNSLTRKRVAKENNLK